MSAVQYIRGARGGARPRAVRWLAGVLGAGLLLASCGTAPGAAAVVDGVRISEQVVQDRAQALVSENVPAEQTATIDPVSWAGLNRYQVNDAVRHQLVLAAAKDQRISVGPAEIDSFIAQHKDDSTPLAVQLTVPAATLRNAVYDLLAVRKLAAKLPAAGMNVTNVSVKLDAVLVGDRDAAIAARTRYQSDPGALDADAAAARAAGQAPPQDESLLTSPDDAVFGLFSAPKDQVVLISQGTSGYYVARVTQRTTTQAKLTKDMLTSASSLGGEQVLGTLLLSKYATDVTINPRFGQWDAQMMLVVPSNNGL